MKQLTAEQIKSNWETYLKIVDRFISDERKPKLLDLYSKLEDILVLSPASTKTHYHNAFAGGYVDHVIRVVQASLKLNELWESLGANIDFTTEELVFSALNHDLGKIGYINSPLYIPQTDKWRQEKLSEIYTINKDLSYMTNSDRALFILQKYEIPVSENEYLAIKLHDGMYNEANKSYLVSYNPESKLKSNISLILHQADVLASTVEFDKSK